MKHNVPDKLIKLIKLIMQRTKMKVKVNNREPLSAVLFSAVLDSVVTNLEVGGNITTRLKQI